jgi:hypothetical protein
MLLLWWIYGTQRKEIYYILVVYIFGYYTLVEDLDSDTNWGTLRFLYMQ